MKNDVMTTHRLDFLCADGIGAHKYFIIGTCQGQWGSTWDSYYILSVINSDPGNGHLEDVFQWFEHSCKRDSKNLLVLEILNSRFYCHLLKRGFIPLDTDGDNVIKVFNQQKYETLLKTGNEIILPVTLKCI